MDGILDLNGKQISKEDQAKEATKNSILAIESLFFAINSTSFLIKYHDGLVKGLEFLGQLHNKLLAELGPDEVEKMRKQYAKPEVKPNGTAA